MNISLMNLYPTYGTASQLNGHIFQRWRYGCKDIFTESLRPDTRVKTGTFESPERNKRSCGLCWWSRFGIIYEVLITKLHKKCQTSASLHLFSLSFAQKQCYTKHGNVKKKKKKKKKTGIKGCHFTNLP